LVYNKNNPRLLGYNIEEFEPHVTTLSELIHPGDKPAVIQALQEHLDGKTDFYQTDKRYRMKSGEYKWIRTQGRVYTRDEKGRPLRMLGTYCDISRQKQVEEELRSARTELEQRVATKTMDLSEANTTMKVLLKHIEMNRLEVEENVATNIMDKILPHINKFKLDGLNANQKASLALIEENLRLIASPFLKNLQSRYPGFTPQEIHIADLIRGNKSSKEIAHMINISTKTVDLIRYRIRKKLGITNKKIHLGAYLSAI
jgi:PAS domain S-box-containing protein